MTSAALIGLLAGFGLGSVVAGAVVYLLARHFLPSYLSEKGRNLATREDIEEITRKVEGVRSQYTSLVEELKARHQLRLAAVDRRLQAHQEAFTMWRKLMGATYTDEIGKVVIECQSWWEENCIYLEPAVREGFVAAYGAAHSHAELLKSRPSAEVAMASWNHIIKFPDILFRAVQLPALSELEAKALGVIAAGGA